MAENNLGLSVIAGLDKPKSVAQINSDILAIEAQLKKLKLQVKIDGKSNSDIQRQISALNKQKRNLYVDLKIRKNDLKRQYNQAVNELQNNPISVKVNTSNAQKQMTGLTNSVKNTKDETFSLANALRKALNNTGYVISSQLALQLVRNAAREATDALKEYDKYATNLSIITNGTRAESNNIIADLSEKSFEFKVDISELENAYETLLRTGKAAGELDDYLKSTVFLSKIGFEDMETSASNLVIAQINGDVTSLDAPTFDNDNTDPNKDAFDKLYSKWQHDLEMNIKIRFHDLRHSAASLLINAGFNLKEVQEWLGHSDVATTGNIYSHLQYSSKINMANRFNDILSK